MEKRSYTHVQMLLLEFEAMLTAGKTQREVAEQLGGNSVYVKRYLRILLDCGLILQRGLAYSPSSDSTRGPV